MIIFIDFNTLSLYSDYFEQIKIELGKLIFTSKIHIKFININTEEYTEHFRIDEILLQFGYPLELFSIPIGYDNTPKHIINIYADYWYEKVIGREANEFVRAHEVLDIINVYK